MLVVISGHEHCCGLQILFHIEIGFYVVDFMHNVLLNPSLVHSSSTLVVVVVVVLYATSSEECLQ